MTPIPHRFNPDNVAVYCPACQRQKKGEQKALRPVDETTRECIRCGRREHWTQPNRAELGARRYQRLRAFQRKSFGALDILLPQWIVESEKNISD